MMKFSILFLASALLATVGGCDHSNANYCAGKFNDDCRSDGGTGVTGCVAAPDKCTGATPVCDTAMDVCVACLENNKEASSCPAAAPVCSSQTCGGCTADAQCDSGVCRADGTCSAANTVVYVSPMGNGTACTADVPCSLEVAPDQVQDMRKVVHLAPGNYPVPLGVMIPAAAILVGRGATVSRGSTGPTIATSVDLTVEFVTVTGGGSATGLGFLVTGGAFVLTRAVVFGNRGGGLSLAGGSFKITNNVIVENGDAGTGGSAIGGVALSSSVNGNIFEQNTVAYNHSAIGDPGIKCTTVAGFSARRNIVTGNNLVTSFPVQSVSCNDQESYLTPGSSVNDLAFVSNTAPLDFHLTAGSPATVRDVPGLTTCPGVDIDGEARPKNALCDLGADEF